MRKFFTRITPIILAIGVLSPLSDWVVIGQDARLDKAKVQAQPGATKEQFDRVEIGMSEDQVATILGQPTKKSRGHGTLKNGTHAPIVLPYHYAGMGGAVVEINFYLQHVTGKRWINPQSEEQLQPAGFFEPRWFEPDTP